MVVPSESGHGTYGKFGSVAEFTFESPFANIPVVLLFNVIPKWNATHMGSSLGLTENGA